MSSSFNPNDPMRRTLEKDSMTKRPRTPDNMYTALTNTQIRNIKNDRSPFFHIKTKSNYPDKRYYMDRYAYSMSQHNVRGLSESMPYCYVGDQFNQHPAQKYDSCKRGAWVRWGVGKAGLATNGHFYGEPVDGFMNIDMYRRSATNKPGPIHMDYGRPVEGYYLQKNASNTTWNESSVPLNRTAILQNIQPKTMAEYDQIHTEEQTQTMNHPLYYNSEYTDRFTNKQQTEVILNNLQQKKKWLTESQNDAQYQLYENKPRTKLPILS